MFRRLVAAILLTASGIVAAMGADVSEELLAMAIQRYEAGEYQSAIGTINAALRDRLPGSLTAKAYYYRGLANRKAGRPADAINDLTRATAQLGLTDAELSDAKENLQVAYQEAGLSPRERVVVARDSAAERAASKPERGVTASAPMATGAVVAPKASGSASSDGWSTSATASAAPPPASAQRSSSWTNQQIALAPLPIVPTPVEKRKPRAAEPAPVSTGPVQRASLTPAFATQVLPAPAPTGETRLLVGEAHSRGEAFALAVRLTSQRGASLGPGRPQIAASADASTYRLRLGPFADPGQAFALCKSLRDSGYVCTAE
jgi:tetratricopeptide (TPR) repeat protein